MPLKKCTEGGKSGWKWGDSGHCYTGKDAKKKAIKQGVAVEGPDKFKEEMSDATNHYPADTLIEAGRALRDYEEATAKIRPHGDQWKIVGYGDQLFDTKQAAIDFQYGYS